MPDVRAEAKGASVLDGDAQTSAVDEGEDGRCLGDPRVPGHAGEGSTPTR